MPLQSPYTNGFFSSPDYGRWDIKATALGYGMSIVSSEGEARTTRTFYPMVRTSGLWFVEAVFTTIEERDLFNYWMAVYMWRVADPNEPKTLAPMTVSVPSQNFTKVGYPTSPLVGGAQFAEVSWTVRMAFASASDPATGINSGSDPVAPMVNGRVGAHFYPWGTQDYSSTAEQEIAYPEDEPWAPPATPATAI